MLFINVGEDAFELLSEDCILVKHLLNLNIFNILSIENQIRY